MPVPEIELARITAMNVLAPTSPAKAHRTVDHAERRFRWLTGAICALLVTFLALARVVAWWLSS